MAGIGDVMVGAALLLALVATALSVWCVACSRSARDEARSATRAAQRVASWCGVPGSWLPSDPRAGVGGDPVLFPQGDPAVDPWRSAQPREVASPDTPTETIPTQEPGGGRHEG